MARRIHVLWWFGFILTLSANAQVSSYSTSLDDGISVSISDAQFGFKLKGRMQLDYVNMANENETLTNEADVKRVWLTLSGYAKEWFFLHRFDVDGNADLSSYVEYRGFSDLANIGFGRYKEPFGMSWIGSIKHVSTPERSAISDRYTFGRSVGVMLRKDYANFGYRVGVFQDGDEDEKAADHLALTGRMYTSPIKQSGVVFHVGLGISSRHLEDALGVEMAYVNGPFHVQTEWMRSDPDDASDISGVYVESGWFITKDSMSYKKGVFTNLRPRHQRGAWQIVARYDHGDGDYADIGLGDQNGEAVALGLNWFANNNARLSLSYTRGRANNESGKEFRLRAQYTF